MPMPAEFTSTSSPPKRSLCSRTMRTASSSTSDVRGDRVRAELGGCRFDLGLRPRGQRQVVALVAEHARDRQADARRAAGDECARHPVHESRGIRGRAANRAGARPFPLPRMTAASGRRLRLTCELWTPRLRADRPRDRRWMRGEVLARAARGTAARLRAGRGGRSARRARPGRRRGRLPPRRRARARVHHRLLSADRRRPLGLRCDRSDERAERRVRDGRPAAARAVGCRIARGAARRDGARDLRRCRAPGAGGRRGARGWPHDQGRRAEVRARRGRHGPPGRCLAQVDRAPR